MKAADKGVWCWACKLLRKQRWMVVRGGIKWGEVVRPMVVASANCGQDPQWHYTQCGSGVLVMFTAWEADMFVLCVLNVTLLCFMITIIRTMSPLHQQLLSQWRHLRSYLAPSICPITNYLVLKLVTEQLPWYYLLWWDIRLVIHRWQLMHSLIHSPTQTLWLMRWLISWVCWP